MVPPERRLLEAVALVDRQAYFVVHAPRQTGKTTTMRALARRITEDGRYAALHFSCESARAFPDDVAEAAKGVWFAIEQAAARELAEPLRPPRAVEAPVAGYLHAQLTR